MGVGGRGRGGWRACAGVPGRGGGEGMDEVEAEESSSMYLCIFVSLYLYIFISLYLYIFLYRRRAGAGGGSGEGAGGGALERQQLVAEGPVGRLVDAPLRLYLLPVGRLAGFDLCGEGQRRSRPSEKLSERSTRRRCLS
jgi:hypothetical protein